MFDSFVTKGRLDEQKRFLTMLLLVVLFVSTSVSASSSINGHSVSHTGVLKVSIHPVFKDAPLQLNTQKYVDIHGDTLIIEVFKTYVGNLTLVDASGEVSGEKNKYHLVDIDKATTQTFFIPKLNEGKYSTLGLLIGVDSLANVSGAMDGDLDPSIGMYWAWNSGYIMAKLEGRSNVCSTLHHTFEFHIGGYIAPYAAYRTVILKPGNEINIVADDTTEVVLTVDAATWLDSKHVVDLSKTNNIVVPGKDACDMAENYASMFAIKQVFNP